jgi:hypothetical protein
MAQTSPKFVNYGHDLSCLTDLDPAMLEVDGRMLLGQALARRLQTVRGTLIDDANYGFDLCGEIDDDLITRDIARITSQVDAEFVKDDRVLSSTSVGVFVSGALTLVCTIVDLIGPFKLTLVATSVTVAVLKVSN